MADIKISDLNVQAAPDTPDLLETVDVSDTSSAPTGTNKKLTLNTLQSWLSSFFAPASHPGETNNPHSVQHTQTSPVANEHINHAGVTLTAGGGLTGGGDITANRSFAVGAGNAITVNANDISVNESAITHNNLSGRTTASAHPTSAITGLDAALTAKLENVVEDLSPELGGNLLTNGNDVLIEDNGGVAEIGRVGVTSGDEGVYLARTTAGGGYDPNDGAFFAGSGLAEINGTAAIITALKHSETTEQQVLVNSDGNLYARDVPPTGWTETDTDATDYDLGSPGTGTGTWVDLGTLNITTPQDVQSGERIDGSVTLYVSNKTTNRSGNLEIYLSVDGTVPGAADVDDFDVVAPGFVGALTMGFIDTADQFYAAGTDVSVYARAAAGDGPGFGLDLLGATLAPHRLLVSSPQGGTGVTDFISLTDTPANYSGAAGQTLVVNGTETGVEFTTPAGGGDVVGPAISTDNAVPLFDGTTGKLIKNSSLIGGDVALLSTTQAFTGDKAFNGPSGTQFQNGIGVLTGNVSLSSGVLTEQTVNILYPTTEVETGTTITPTLAPGNNPRIINTNAGTVTVNPPTAGVGEVSILIKSATGLAVGAFDYAINNPPAAAPALCYVERDSAGETAISWANGQ